MKNIFKDRQTSEFGEAIENVKDFDITKLSSENYFYSLIESIRQVVEMREDVEIRLLDIELGKRSEGKGVTILEDG